MATSTQYNPQLKLKGLLQRRFGIDKTVYAWFAPELQQAYRDYHSTLQLEQQIDMLSDAWTQKQDSAHKSFYAAWRDWTANVLTIDEGFSHFYPTTGASEPLRQIIFDLAAQNQAKIQQGQTPARLFVFAGEYEGARAMAEAAGLTVISLPRAQWADVATQMNADDLFYLSHPSAIDGTVWADYDGFMQSLSKANKRALLDITYVGAVARDYHIDTRHSAISEVIFSLSKPLGAYYLRIGGCLTRQENMALFGNVWFKNLHSLGYGEYLLKRFAVQELPQKYAPLQAEITQNLAQRMGVPFTPADVLLLATAANVPMRPQGRTLPYLARVNDGQQNVIRICLTPALDKASRNILE